MMNTAEKKVKVGLIGVGLCTYWDQFEGLLPRLTGYQQEIGNRISDQQAVVIDGGMVDTPEKAIRAAEELKSEEIEILFIFISTYALSHNPTHQNAGYPLKPPTRSGDRLRLYQRIG